MLNAIGFCKKRKAAAIVTNLQNTALESEYELLIFTILFNFQTGLVKLIGGTSFLR